MEALAKITVALPKEEQSQSLVYFDYQNVNSPSSQSCMRSTLARYCFSSSNSYASQAFRALFKGVV